MASEAGPFLKWAGGKKRLLPVILPRLPARIRTFHEPFVGGGAVFFALAEARRFERAVISDKNADLVNLYRVVRDRPHQLCAQMQPHAERAGDEAWFYLVRAQNPADLSSVERAARFLFLNRTCFNGLYRVNRSGAFNVPFGRYKNPKVLDPDRIEAASRALRGVEIRCQDFEAVADEIGPGDAVYFDPPYVPVSQTASFHHYHAEAFGAEAQGRLLATLRRCWERGAVAVLSNSDCEFTRGLYAGLEVEVVLAPRAINSDPSGRGLVQELLVRGPRAAGSRARGAA